VGTGVPEKSVPDKKAPKKGLTKKNSLKLTRPGKNSCNQGDEWWTPKEKAGKKHRRRRKQKRGLYAQRLNGKGQPRNVKQREPTRLKNDANLGSRCAKGVNQNKRDLKWANLKTKKRREKFWETQTKDRVRQAGASTRKTHQENEN